LSLVYYHAPLVTGGCSADYIIGSNAEAVFYPGVGDVDCIFSDVGVDDGEDLPAALTLDAPFDDKTRLIRRIIRPVESTGEGKPSGEDEGQEQGDVDQDASCSK
jgi:hypothetical protein